jgi:fructosamine-3-kinase
MEKVLKEKIDPSLNSANLSTLGARALKMPVEAVSAGILTGGCWNRVISVSFRDAALKGNIAHKGDTSSAGETMELVFKINPEVGSRSLEREYTVLDFFARNTEMPVPVPRLLDSSGEIIPGTVLVMDKIPGSVLHHLFGFLSRRQRESVSEQLGHFVGRLHERRSTGFGGVELSEGERRRSWSDFWLPRFDKVFEEISGKNLLAASFLDAVADARKSFPAFLNIGAESTLTHYDIWSGNVMAEQNGSSFKITGFIDIPGHWSDYARELSFMEMFGCADDIFYSVYREYRSLDEDFALRKNIYNLKMHLKHITMYPDQSYYREGADTCLAFIRRTAGYS